MLLSLSGRTNTQHSPSIAPSPISLWRVSNFLVTGWHGFIIPVMCVNLASAINVSSPFSRSYFAHRYSIFCELLLGTALTLHAKVKNPPQCMQHQDGLFTRRKMWSSWILHKFKKDASTIIIFFRMSKYFFEKNHLTNYFSSCIGHLSRRAISV